MIARWYSYYISEMPVTSTDAKSAGKWILCNRRKTRNLSKDIAMPSMGVGMRLGNHSGWLRVTR
jgi:hypothetical protein